MLRRTLAPPRPTWPPRCTPLDNAPDMVFVRTQADAGNAAAAGVIASLSLAWERYTLLKDAVDRLDSAVAGRRGLEIDTLLGPLAVKLPDGTSIGIAQLAEDIQLRVDQIGPRLSGLAGTARQAVARLDAASAATADIVARATAIGAGGDVEVTSLQAALSRAVTAVSADPGKDAGLAELDRLVAEAGRRVALLERHRQTVPADLTAAAAQVAAIEDLVGRARAALALTRTKMADTAGLSEPPDLDAGGDRALRPWLARLEASAGAGQWEAAAAGLTAWKAAADTLEADAQRALDAGAAPLARRNELRGLLDAYRAKAGAVGRVEDGNLARLYEEARQVLYTAPCVLATAEGLVQQYVAAVNAAKR